RGGPAPTPARAATKMIDRSGSGPSFPRTASTQATREASGEIATPRNSTSCESELRTWSTFGRAEDPATDDALVPSAKHNNEARVCIAAPYLNRGSFRKEPLKHLSDFSN